MKKISNLMLSVAAALTFTACSSDDVVNPSVSGDLTVTVATESTMSRGALTPVEGYELKCVMQLLDEDNNTVNVQAEEAQSIVSAEGGIATFTIPGTAIDDGAVKALFWAEYVPVNDADTKVYNSTDLKSVKYNETTFDMSNANLMAAADAFAGTITNLTNGAKATLTRPLIRFSFTPKNPELAADYNALSVKYQAPSAFSVLTSNCVEADAQELTYTDNSFTADGTWITSYIFAPANIDMLGSEITMTLTGTGVTEKTLTIPAEKVPLDANTIVNSEAEISKDPTADLTVSIEIDGYFENEEKPAEPAQFEVGAYVDAAGVPTNNVEDAVAIIFYEGALAGDVIDNYPAEYAGKEIAGYAVALENAAATRQAINTDNVTDLTQTSYTNGTQNTENLLSNAGIKDNAFATAFNTFVTGHTLTAEGTTTTGWYIPVQTQLQAWLSMILPTSSNAATGSDAFKALFPISGLYDRDPIAVVFYASCSVNSNGNISGARLETTETVSFAQIAVKTGNQAALCRPMITIFK